MSEAERLAELVEHDSLTYSGEAAAELRRLSAELAAERAENAEQCRIIGLSAERELALRSELAALKAAMGEPVGFVTPETVTLLKQFDEEDWCAIWNRQTSKVTVPLYAIPRDKP